MAWRVKVRDVFALLAIAGLSFVVLLWLMPNVKPARTEARIETAYNMVRLMHDEFQNEAPMNPGTRRETAEKDPWDRPYVAETFLANGEPRLRILSQGPSPATDEDDIYSDMPVSPLLPFQERRDREAIRALVIAGVIWMGLSLFYYKRHITERRERSD